MPQFDATSIRVLQSVRREKHVQNPYLDLLLAAIPPTVTTLHFTYGRALRGGYDVFHVQWPEHLLHSKTTWRRLLKIAGGLLLLLRLQLSRTVVVRTVHNLDAHDGTTTLSRWLERWLERRTDAYVVLNHHTPTRTGAPVLVLPHGHYRAWPGYAEAFSHAAPRSAQVEPTVLFFGQLRAYKGVERLLDAVESGGFTGTLRIVGKAEDPAYAATLEARVARLDGVTLRAEFVDEGELARELLAADLVALPYPRFFNSGAALLALSASRPVLVTRSPVTEDLRQEVGESWVRLVDDLDGHVLQAAAQSARATVLSEASPDLSSRDWSSLSRSLADFYLALVRPRGAAR